MVVALFLANIQNLQPLLAHVRTFARRHSLSLTHLLITVLSYFSNSRNNEKKKKVTAPGNGFVEGLSIV